MKPNRSEKSEKFVDGAVEKKVTLGSFIQIWSNLKNVTISI